MDATSENPQPLKNTMQNMIAYEQNWSGKSLKYALVERISSRMLRGIFLAFYSLDFGLFVFFGGAGYF